MWSRDIFLGDSRLLVPKNYSDSLEKIWKSVKLLNFFREEHIFIEFLITIIQ